MIQIDMKMPEHCVDCPFSLDNCCLVLGKYISLKQLAKGGIQKWCPMKEKEEKEQISDAIHETAKQFRQTIVRCKDCKHGKIHGIDVECVAHEEVGYDPEPWHPLDWFCADGERRK